MNTEERLKQLLVRRNNLNKLIFRLTDKKSFGNLTVLEESDLELYKKQLNDTEKEILEINKLNKPEINIGLILIPAVIILFILGKKR